MTTVAEMRKDYLSILRLPGRRPCPLDQKGTDNPVHDAQHLTHDLRIGREQVAQGERSAQHPLPDWPLR